MLNQYGDVWISKLEAAESTIDRISAEIDARVAAVHDMTATYQVRTLTARWLFLSTSNLHMHADTVVTIKVEGHRQGTATITTNTHSASARENDAEHWHEHGESCKECPGMSTCASWDNLWVGEIACQSDAGKFAESIGYAISVLVRP